MKILVLASAILFGLSASAGAREIYLLCRADGSPYVHFDVGVDMEAAILTVYQDRDRSSRYQATITPDYIEYFSAMTTTRFDRNSGDWAAWTYAGTMTGRGSCQMTDDRRRLDEDLPSVLKLKE